MKLIIKAFNIYWPFSPSHRLDFNHFFIPLGSHRRQILWSLFHREQASILTSWPTQDLVANQRTTVAGAVNQAWLWGPRFALRETPFSWGQWGGAGSKLVFSVAIVSPAPPKSCPQGPDHSSRTMQGRSDGGQQEVQQAVLVILSGPVPWGPAGARADDGLRASLSLKLSISLGRGDFRRTDQRSKLEFAGAVTESCSRFRAMARDSKVPLQWSGTGCCESSCWWSGDDDVPVSLENLLVPLGVFSLKEGGKSLGKFRDNHLILPVLDGHFRD